MSPQCEKMLAYLQQHGSITGMESITKLRVMNYKGRIYDLRKAGYIIMTDNVTQKNQDGETITFARYRLVTEVAG